MEWRHLVLMTKYFSRKTKDKKLDKIECFLKIFCHSTLRKNGTCIQFWEKYSMQTYVCSPVSNTFLVARLIAVLVNLCIFKVENFESLKCIVFICCLFTLLKRNGEARKFKMVIRTYAKYLHDMIGNVIHTTQCGKTRNSLSPKKYFVRSTL